MSRTFACELADAQKLFEGERYEDAFSAYEKLAQSGSTHAQVFLGWMYLNGLGVERDEKHASELLDGAARLGSSSGQFWLAKSLTRVGDLDAAVRWFERSAANGYSPAYYRLGWIYESGKGVDRDVDRALRYYAKGETLGHVFAKRNIARILIRGEYGFLSRLLGVGKLIVAFVGALWILLRDQYDDRLIQ